MGRPFWIWVVLLCTLALPVIAAGFSPYLAFRQPIYIAAGFAGIIGLALMPLQPLLAAGVLPGLTPLAGRKLHRWVGVTLLICVILHVVGLWITSPPDVVDVLLFRSPAPFSLWGAIAMWAIFAAALLALARARLRLPWHIWRRCHAALATLAVCTTVVHAVLIEGAMEVVSKYLLAAIAVGVTLKTLFDLRIWARKAR